MENLGKFIDIFEGLNRAHGVTIVGESNGNGSKVKGKSFVKKGIAGGLGYMFFGNVGLAAGALATGNDVLKQKSGTIGIEFKDKNWIVTKFDLRNSDSKDFFRLLLELIKTKHPPKKKDKAPF